MVSMTFCNGALEAANDFTQNTGRNIQNCFQYSVFGAANVFTPHTARNYFELRFLLCALIYSIVSVLQQSDCVENCLTSPTAHWQKCGGHIYILLRSYSLNRWHICRISEKWCKRGLLIISLFALSNILYTVKKGIAHSRPQPGCYLPNSPWPGIFDPVPVPGRFGQNKSRNLANLFYSVSWRKKNGIPTFLYCLSVFSKVF